MSLSKLVFTDLDDTLVVSKRRFDTLEGERVALDLGQWVMTEKQYDFYQSIVQTAQEIIPVTARNIENYLALRSEFAKHNIFFSDTAVVNYGTDILTFDDDSQRILTDGNYTAYQAEHCQDIQTQLLAAEQHFEAVKTYSDMGKRCYLKVPHNAVISDEQRKIFKVVKVNTGLILLPKIHNKAFAVNYLLKKQKSPNLMTIGIGNAEVDAEFMDLLDLGIRVNHINPQFD